MKPKWHVECVPAPRISLFAAGPLRIANLLRGDRSYWVTVWSSGPIPLYRVSYDSVVDADRAVDELVLTLERGDALPTQSIRRRLLPLRR
jgi:hypothetical protein